MNREIFARRLNAALRRSAASQTEFARSLGVDPGQVSRWLAAKAMPNAQNLRKIYAILPSLDDEDDSEVAEVYVTYRASLGAADENAVEAARLVEGLSVDHRVFSPALAVIDVYAEAPDVAAQRNLGMLNQCHTLIYCQFTEDGRSASGMVEIGIALAAHKNVLLLVADPEWSPFLLEGLAISKSALPHLGTARMYRCGGAEEALAVLRSSVGEWFGPSRT